MAKSIVQLVLTIRNPVAFVKNYVRIHIIFQDNEISKSQFVGDSILRGYKANDFLSCKAWAD